MGGGLNLGQKGGVALGQGLQLGALGQQQGKDTVDVSGDVMTERHVYFILCRPASRC